MSQEKQNLSVTKSNNMIDAGFFKKMNSIEMRVFNLAVSQLNPQWDKNQCKQFEFTVKEFLDQNPAIASYNDAYASVKNAVINLSKIWVEVAPLQGYKKTEVSLLTRRSYNDGKGKFMIEFHDDVLPYLCEIKSNYTSFLLENFGLLKSEHSLKLYEILCRHKFRKKIVISVDDLKNLLGISDKYAVFKDFRRWVIEPAVNEITSKTNISVTFKTIRDGRKIGAIDFYIFDKEDAITALKKRPKFQNKNKFGNPILNKTNPKMGNSDYFNYSVSCLNILENHYENISDITTKDLRNYFVFLSCSESNKSKFGKPIVFLNELKTRGYKIINCELSKKEK